MCATTGMAVLLSLPAGLAGLVRDLLEPSSLAAVASAVAAVCQHLAVDTWHARRLRRHAHYIWAGQVGLARLTMSRGSKIF